MTRQEQAAIKEAKKQAKAAARIEKREQERENRNWQKMVIRFKALGAWIEGNDIETDFLTT